MTVQLLTLPRLGETMEQGRITGWLKKPGDAFRRGETLLEIETDKTVVELPALVDGTLVEILAEAGAEVSVGLPIARVDAAPGALGPEPEAEPPGRVEPAVASEEPMEAVPPPAATGAVPSQGERVRASPLARRLARAAGLDLAAIPGGGRRGRVTGDDVRRAAAASAAAPGTGVAEGRIPFAGGSLALRSWPVAGSARGSILLVHGFGGDAAGWAGLAAGLARSGWRVAALDLPSHGATDVEAVTVEDLTLAVLAALDRQPDGCVLIGHSIGAVAAAEAAARAAPGRVARLVLLAPAGMGTVMEGGFVDAWAHARTRAGLRHALRLLSPTPPAYSDAQLDALLAGIRAHPGLPALAEAIVHHGRQQVDIVTPLTGLDLPVSAIIGLEDRIVPWTQVAALPARVAVHLVAGAGHMPQWDRPDLVRTLIG